MNRVPAGRLNNIHAPEGTILGPTLVTREYLVVTGNDDQGVTVGYAIPADLEAATKRDPQSVTEVNTRLAAQRQAQMAQRAAHKGL